MAITGKRVKTTTSKCWCELHIGNKGWWRGQDAAFKHLIARLVGQKGRAEKGRASPVGERKLHINVQIC